jgi:hypothetical protein
MGVFAFRLRYSRAVAMMLNPDARADIVKQAVTIAERRAPDAGESAIFEFYDPNLRVIVQFAERMIWVFTSEEADRAGVPKPTADHTCN